MVGRRRKGAISMAMIHATGKVVYWVLGRRFYNTKGLRDGHDKAEEYCLDNFLNPKESIIQFDSDTEADYYDYLLEKQNAGEISNLNHHYLLKVQDGYTNANGDEIPPITYNADFVYKDEKTGKRVVVDVKGSPYFITNDGGRFVLLKEVFDKVFLDKGLYIQIIIRENKEWKEWKIGDKKKSQKLIKKQRAEIKALRAEAQRQAKQQKQIQKEKEMILRYREWLHNGHGLTKAQVERLKELEAKYNI